MANETNPFAKFNIPRYERQDAAQTPIDPKNPFGSFNVPKYGEEPPPAAAAEQYTKPEFMQPDRPPAQDMSWTETLGKAKESFIPSLKENVHQIITPFVQPKETLEALSQVGTGAISKAKGALGYSQTAEQKEQDEAAINAIGKFYADRYGSMEGFKRAIAEDPVGVMSDLSIPFTGGGSLAAKAPGAIGKVGTAVKTVGTYMDPLSAAAQGIKGGTKLATAAATLPEWWTTGASFQSLNKAADAGLSGNAAFREYLIGQKKPADAIERIEKARDAIVAERSQEISKRLCGIGDTPMSYANTEKAINEAFDRISLKGTPVDDPAALALKQVAKKLEEFKANPEITPNVQALQNLKVAVNNIKNQHNLTPTAKGAFDHIYHSIRNEIGSLKGGVGKKYMDAMEHYAAQTEKLNSIKADLIGGRDSAAQVRKLLKEQDSITKKNLIADIAKYDPDIPYIVAGLELSHIWPKGIRGILSGIGSGISSGSLIGIPAGVGAALVHSPMVIGAGQYGVGYLGGAPSRMFGAIPGSSTIPTQAGRAEALTQDTPRNDALIDQAMQYVRSLPDQGIRQIREYGARLQASGGRVGRATGGRTNGLMTAEMLMQAAHNAKKKISKTTEEILNAPDEAVVKALSVAKQHI